MRPAALVGLAAGAALGAWAIRRLDVVEVRGRSMEPSLLAGDRLLVLRAAPRVGDVVLAADPRAPDRELIKRVARIDAEGVWLVGDNLERSTDARTFGAVAPSGVRWRAVARYWPLRRPDRSRSRRGASSRPTS
jgi:nickel-type superoxide dismutase maturation protease